MFLGLSGTVFFDNTAYLKRKTGAVRIALGSFLFPVVLSGLIEIMQEYLTATRSGDWMDFLFDVIGALLGSLICRSIDRRLRS
ncbi:MAG: hypothetical protein EZS26_001188 [Candidatus Ordinivivax streblomastigis]|uniref:VanZ-like domain-containing protein n=1 Tax=Candidatus Ordinivivax streblomastigis TaxID=2540710 RepID=A0A5M8P2N6_9BACT|nr:MAG: hypothetical protein EZS26_001188 [Candidatus Ordinivivax streblomastigis]